MHNPERISLEYPVLVVAYDDKSRAALVVSLESFGARAVPCETFCQAEKHALSENCKGLLVDLVSMVRAKEDEKVIAHTLSGLYPTMRVKCVGPQLIPMATAGDVKQENTLESFLSKTCADFMRRKLRSNKRREVCIPIYVKGERGFTLNLSWSGVFIADPNPERFNVGEEVPITFLTDNGTEFSAEVTVARIRHWGERQPPGIGAKFNNIDEDLEHRLFSILKSNRERDRDRLVV